MSSYPSLETKIGGISLKSCIYNASGPRTGSIEALEKIGASASAAILSKSATLVKQDGNQLPRFINKIYLGDQIGLGSMNSEGLPNAGIDYYISSDAVTALTKFGKPYIVSLSGLSLEDNMEMLDRVLKVAEITSIEINLACPNIPNKPIVAYDYEQLEMVLTTFTSHKLIKSKPIGVKLAPYFDTFHYDRVISIIAKFDIQYIVTINTIGNGLFVDWDSESAVIAAKGGFGGIGGGFVKPIALANVRIISQMLEKYGRSNIDIVGVGGVYTGKDAFELILCGAKAVQVSSCHWTEGSSCFERISNELRDIMKAKGYKTIEDFRGKLKPYDPKYAPKLRNLYQAKSTAEVVNVKNPSSGSSFAALAAFEFAVIVALLAIIAKLQFYS